jgi:hypothetical protein
MHGRYKTIHTFVCMFIPNDETWRLLESKVFEGVIIVLEIVVHYIELRESKGVSPPGLRVVFLWYSQTAYCREEIVGAFLRMGAAFCVLISLLGTPVFPESLTL